MTNENILNTITKQIQYDFTKKTSEEVADLIGILERDAYFNLLSDWKSEYKAISKVIQDARSLRKGGNEEGSGGFWNSVARSRSSDAKRLMKIREAVSILGRRHWEMKQAPAAA